MKVFLSELSGIPYTIEGDINLASFGNGDNPSLHDISTCHVLATFTLNDDIIDAEVEINALVHLNCAYTLKVFPHKLNVLENLVFTLKNNDDPELIPLKGNVLDLDHYIFGIILTEIPLKVIAPGAKLPTGGEGYRVLSESELKQEKENNRPFADLSIKKK